MTRDAPPRQRFTLYVANGRIYARNVRRHLIDLGPADEQAGAWRYTLDGEESIAARHLPNADAVLRDLEDRLTFLFLDGQFTSLPDLTHEAGVELAGVPMREIVLDEVSGGEAPTADEIRVLGGTADTPHATLPAGPPR